MKNDANQKAFSEAVEWKLFEIQSSLIAEDADDYDLEQGRLWLQTRHYFDILEERSNDSRCGFPTCGKCITLNTDQQFRIDYHSKEIYKIANSGLFCSNLCLQKSFMFEKTLSDTMPHSRDVAKSLDVNTLKRTKIGDLLQVLGSSDTTKSIEFNSIVNFNEVPPYSNTLLSSDGAVLVTLSDTAKSGKVNLGQKEAKDILSNLTTSINDNKDNQSKTVRKNNIPTVGVDSDRPTEETTPTREGSNSSDVDLQSIFAQMSSIKSKNNLKVGKVPVIKEKPLKEVRWTEPDSAATHKSSVVAENRASAPKAVSIMNGRLGEVVERMAPRPMSEGAMMLKQEAATVQKRQQSQQLEQDEEDRLNGAASNSDDVIPTVEEPPDGVALSSSSIEGYLADNLKFLKVAPSNSVRSLSYDPFAPWGQGQNQTAADNSLSSEAHSDESAREEGEGEGDVSEDYEEEEQEDADFVPEEGESSSLFLSVWSTLDDLFSYTLILLAEDIAPPAAGTSRGNDRISPQRQRQDDPVHRAPIAAESQQVQHAIITLLDRGIKTAEKTLGVMRLLQSHSQQSSYSNTKNRVLSGISGRLTKCPSLRGSGWTLIGLLLVDAIMVRRGLLPETISSEVWTVTVESSAAALLGGGHIAGSMLRMDDMKILRSFFDQL